MSCFFAASQAELQAFSGDASPGDRAIITDPTFSVYTLFDDTDVASPPESLPADGIPGVNRWVRNNVGATVTEDAAILKDGESCSIPTGGRGIIMAYEREIETEDNPFVFGAGSFDNAEPLDEGSHNNLNGVIYNGTVLRLDGEPYLSGIEIQEATSTTLGICNTDTDTLVDEHKLVAEGNFLGDSTGPYFAELSGDPLTIPTAMSEADLAASQDLAGLSMSFHHGHMASRDSATSKIIIFEQIAGTDWEIAQEITQASCTDSTVAGFGQHLTFCKAVGNDNILVIGDVDGGPAGSNQGKLWSFRQVAGVWTQVDSWVATGNFHAAGFEMMYNRPRAEIWWHTPGSLVPGICCIPIDPVTGLFGAARRLPSASFITEGFDVNQTSGNVFFIMPDEPTNSITVFEVVDGDISSEAALEEHTFTEELADWYGIGVRGDSLYRMGKRPTFGGVALCRYKISEGMKETGKVYFLDSMYRNLHLVTRLSFIFGDEIHFTAQRTDRFPRLHFYRMTDIGDKMFFTGVWGTVDINGYYRKKPTAVTANITLPANTQVLYLADIGRTGVMKKWTGSAWVAHSDIGTGNTLAGIEAGFIAEPNNPGFPLVDEETPYTIRIGLYTDDYLSSPEINSITVTDAQIDNAGLRGTVEGKAILTVVGETVTALNNSGADLVLSLHSYSRR